MTFIATAESKHVYLKHTPRFWTNLETGLSALRKNEVKLA